MKNHLFFFAFLSIFIPGILIAQPDVLWTQYYGNGLRCEGHDVMATSDGGFIVTGTYDYMGVNDGSLYLMKTDENGDTLWTNTWGGTYYDFGMSVIETNAGGFLVAGNSYLGGPTIMQSMYIIMTNESGSTLWTRHFGAGYASGESVIKSGENEFVIAGYSNDAPYFIKIDSAGDTIWTRIYSINLESRIYDIAETDDGGYIATGQNYNPLNWNYDDLLLMKLDSEGDSVWTKYIGGPGGDYGYAVLALSGEGYLICGRTTSFTTSMYDLYIVKTDLSGNVLWERNYGSPILGDGGYDLIEAADQGYIIAGMYGKWDPVDPDIWLVKIDTDGDTIWTMTIGDVRGDVCWGINAAPGGEYILTGEANSNMENITDLFLIRLSSENTEVLPGEGNNLCDFTLHPPHPNPFNAAVTLDFTLPQSGYLTISVFDVTGKEVATLFNGPLSSGAGTVTWNAENIPSGVYFARLESGGSAQTRKLLLVK